MEFISKQSYSNIQSLLNKKVHFISDCEFFPNFNIICYIKEISISPNMEYIFKCEVIKPYNKIINVGSNMKNLQFEIV